MRDQKGITVVEVVVISCIVAVFLCIAIPKYIETVSKNKMWEGMTTLMTYESAQLAYYAQSNGKLGPVDSLLFQADSSEYFSFVSDGTGRFKAVTKVQIGKLKKGRWMSTTIDTVGRIPKIRRTSSPGDSLLVKRYLSTFFN